jgi:hypothetical protein
LTLIDEIKVVADKDEESEAHDRAHHDQKEEDSFGHK